MNRDRVIRALAGSAGSLHDVTSEIEMLGILQKGLPIETLTALKKRGIVDESELKTFIALRTLARRKNEKRLSPEESDLISRLARIYDFAVEVFGCDEKARKWLRASNRALRGQHPLDLLKTDYGGRIVESLLGRIAHGIYS